MAGCISLGGTQSSNRMLPEAQEYGMSSQSDKHKTRIGSAIYCVRDRLIDAEGHCVRDLKRASLCSGMQWLCKHV